MSKQPKRVPLGKPLPHTEEQLDRLAEIGEADLDAALADATPEMRELLEARGEDEE